jgi:hypothetical protein
MERLFSPTRQLRDIWEDAIEYRDMDDPFEHTEVQLSVPVEEFLDTSWDWDDLSGFARKDGIDRIIWIVRDTTFIAVGNNLSKNVTDDADFLYVLRATFTTTNGQVHALTLFNDRDFSNDRDLPVSIGACTLFWRAIETSNCVKIRIDSRMPDGESFSSGPILSQFLRGSPLLQRLDFLGLHFEDEHYGALATIQRTDLEVTFSQCTFESQDVEGAFIEWFRHNKVVTKLTDCWIGSRVLQALSGNNSVKELSFSLVDQCGEERIRALSHALATNQGIEALGLTEFEMSNETCRLLFRSLSTHPRIKRLVIWDAYSSDFTYSAETKRNILDAILRMLHLNTVVRKITLPDGFDIEEVYRNSILPRLRMNRNCFEVQRQAVKRSDPSIRPQLLGWALHVVRYNPDLVFRFLSENVPAFVRTEGEEEEEEEEDSTIPLESDPNLVSRQKRKASS